MLLIMDKLVYMGRMGCLHQYDPEQHFILWNNSTNSEKTKLQLWEKDKGPFPEMCEQISFDEAGERIKEHRKRKGIIPSGYERIYLIREKVFSLERDEINEIRWGLRAIEFAIKPLADHSSYRLSTSLLLEMKKIEKRVRKLLKSPCNQAAFLSEIKAIKRTVRPSVKRCRV